MPPLNRNCDPTVGFIRCCFRLKCQTVCKPGSVPLRVCGGDGHSSGTFVAERLTRPTRAAARQARPATSHIVTRGRRLPLLLGLAPGGVYPAAAVTGGAVRSYRTISPLPPLPSDGAVPWGRSTDDGAWRCVSVALSLGSPPPGVTRHRASVEPGLSSLPPTARPKEERPSDRLASDDMGCPARRRKPKR